MNKLSIGLIALLLTIAGSVRADAFIVKDIRIEGLQRLSLGAVFNVLPVSVGDEVGSRALANAAHALFSTGNFQDIQIARDGDILVYDLNAKRNLLVKSDH